MQDQQKHLLSINPPCNSGTCADQSLECFIENLATAGIYGENSLIYSLKIQIGLPQPTCSRGTPIPLVSTKKISLRKTGGDFSLLKQLELNT